MKISMRLKKMIVFGLVTAVCGCGAVALYAMDPIEETSEKENVPLKQVTVREVMPGTYPSTIKVYGEVASKWTTTLKAQVSGEIIHINEKLQPGQRLKVDEMILELDPTHYQAAVAQARLDLENARVNILMAERKAVQAISDWQGAGFQQSPDSPLVFHEPQLKAARAQVAWARKALEKALSDLNHTRIVSPYEGLVVERFADKGETVFSGDNIVKLLSADEVEIRVSLDAFQVKSIGAWQGVGIKIQDPSTGRAWNGEMVRDGGMVDRKTRLRRFYLVPREDGKGLIPGMFVTAFIQGENKGNLLALPESALTRDGQIWQVDRADALRPMGARVAFYENGNVYVENSRDMGPLRVVVTPTPGFIAGTKVAPVIQGES